MHLIKVLLVKNGEMWTIKLAMQTNSFFPTLGLMINTILEAVCHQGDLAFQFMVKALELLNVCIFYLMLLSSGEGAVILASGKAGRLGNSECVDSV